MAFSSGTFTLVSGNPVVTGTTISSTTHNNTMSDIADNGLTLCMLKDGTQTLTANIPFGNFRLTGLGAATARTDAAQAAQVQNFAFNILSTVAGTNTITGAVTPALTAYTNGQLFLFQPVNTNTGQATLNIDSVGAQPIFWNGATATSSMLRAGRSIIVEYISTTSATGMHIIGYTGFIPAAMITTRGDLFCGATANNVVVLPAGADDTVLVATASATAGLAWKSSINLAAIDISGTASSSVINVNTLDIRSSASAAFIVVNTINANILNVSFSASASVMRSNTLDVSASASVSALNATLATIGILTVTATASVSALNATNLDVSTTASVSRLNIGGGIVTLGDTSANSFMTTGFTANQGTADNEIYAGKSTDVVHGMTSITESNTFFTIAKAAASAGGVNISGFSSDSAGVLMVGHITSANNAKTTSGTGAIQLRAALASGTTASALGGSANIMVLRDYITTRFIWGANGEFHADLASTTFDTYNDIELLNAMDMENARRKGRLIKTGFMDWLEKNKAILQKEKIVNYYSEEGPGAMVNFSRLAMLHTGAIRQNSRKIDEVLSTLMDELNERDKRIEALENKLLYIEHKSDNS